ncbi:glycerol kinase GlpK [uncultured Limnohabitans sp.]|uniref:glycerol kinase GlpK n=1 Tax=uncultured Limnohabitans sp. TaxID=768543 RepID=UPI00261F5D68|nr:glycerol kinase GlpK [uncultured Limnohabitans sp.]
MTQPTYLLALDQGTSSSRAIVFNDHGHIVGMAQQEFPQIYPQPGWVEHDPLSLWHSQRDTAQKVLAQCNLTAADIRGVGITNQRETTLLWNRQTGVPLHNAIVWQDRRTEALCQQWREQGVEPLIQQRTGLRLDAYFSATKLRWLLDHIPGARAQAQAGELAFGTVDTWLIWQLTGGQSHRTDISNASRTLLLNIHTGQWDDELLDLFGIPRAVLPEVHASVADFGRVQTGLLGPGLGPVIGGVAGDQQSALLGQACLQAGEVKNTYGTGCFMLMHTGHTALQSHSGLITTCAAQLQPNAAPEYALEGSVFMGGAVVQWLRDGLKAITHSSEVEALAASVNDSDGVVLVPAFAGLGAPYWLPHARGSIQGLTRGSGVAHIARAALESIALQSTVLLHAMQQDAKHLPHLQVKALRVDGGACSNNLLMQMQADLMGLPVVRPQTTETTALGAALLAGLQQGVFSEPGELRERLATERVFEPQWSRDQAEAKLAAWATAVQRS